MVLSVQCTLQDAGKHQRRNNSVNISFRIYMYWYNLISNILILNVKRFSFHVDVANKQGSICFYYQREQVAWNTVHSSATTWFSYHQVELR